MSTEKARQWLDNHPHQIPALIVNQQDINRLLKNHRQADQVARVAIRDPGLALELLIRVNSRRGEDSGRDIVESPLAAISLLGDPVCHNLFRDFSVAEQVLSGPQQLFLFQQLVNRCLHNETQAEHWAIEIGLKTTETVRAAALLAYCGELLCCVHDYPTYLDYIKAGTGTEAAERFFGFQFFELTRLLCDALNLPHWIATAYSTERDFSQTNARLLQFTTQLCHRCEHGWYQDELLPLYQRFAEWTHYGTDKVVARTHLHAIEAARNSYVTDAWQPAARLPLISDQVWGPHLRQTPDTQEQAATVPVPGEPAPSTASARAGTMARIKHLVRQPDTTQSDLVNTCLKGIYRELGMSRVALLLLTKDRKMLKNRMSLGLEQSSPFRQYGVELDQAGLLKLLLKKPQALWINKDSLKKYQPHLPRGLIASIMTDNFVAMSLFIAGKPLGIVYADRSSSADDIDEALFSQFKKIISLTSKALTLLANR